MVTFSWIKSSTSANSRVIKCFQLHEKNTLIKCGLSLAQDDVIFSGSGNYYYSGKPDIISGPNDYVCVCVFHASHKPFFTDFSLGRRVVPITQLLVRR